MSQTEKAAYFQVLKAAGVNFPKHYREYSTDEMKAAYDMLSEGQLQEAAEVARRSMRQPKPLAGAVPPVGPPLQSDPQAMSFFGFPGQQGSEAEPELPSLLSVPTRPRDPNEMAGQRQAKNEDEPIRTDDEGRVWLQEEVLKPAYPKPRGRRVLKYDDPGVVQKTVKNGDYLESFEISGDPANARPAEVKITLPSYQVGVYRDARFPFRICTYNGNNGFMMTDVQDFYGGAELVPEEAKRIYVENVLCYDIRTTVRAIQTEYRQQQLAGHIQ